MRTPFVLLMTLLSFVLGHATASSSPVRETLAIAQQRVAAGEAVLLDVRETADWERGHAACALHAPLSALLLAPARIDALAQARGKIVYAFGATTPARMAAARNALAKHGLSDVRLVDGGVAELASAGLALEFGARRAS